MYSYYMECRVLNLPKQQYLAASSNYLTNTGDSSQKDPNQRYASLRVENILLVRHL